MKSQSSPFLRFVYSIDLPLLILLSVFSIDKVFIKPVALTAALILIRKHLNIKDFIKAPLFYISVCILALFQLLLFNRDFSTPHLISFTIGIYYWLMCLVAFVVVKKSIDTNNEGNIKNTINLFFNINCIVSFSQLVGVMIQSGMINPYASTQTLYSNSTGDYIKGIFLAPCYINMFVNTFFAIYYIYQRKYLLCMLACVVACLTTSNFGNLVYAVCLVFLFVAIKNKRSRLLIGLQLLVFALFYIYISAGNFSYMVNSLAVKHPPRKQKVITIYNQDTALLLTPNGKIVSFRETFDFLRSHKSHLLFGAGIGNFSSFLAVRTSDIEQSRSSRIFQKLPRYIAPDFRDNHYQIFKTVYNLPLAYHSARHMPSSFLNQIFGEYGVIGFLLFALGYILYFIRQYRFLTYTLIMGIAICGYLLFDYLFEYLSVMVFFEMFFLLDMKEHQKPEKTV